MNDHCITDVPVSLLRLVALLEQTTTIPLTRDVGFGFRNILEGAQANPGDTVNVTVKISTPLMKKPDGQTVTGGSSTWQRTIAKIEYAGDGFDDTWEMVPVKRVIQAYFEDRLLGEKAFELVSTQ